MRFWLALSLLATISLGSGCEQSPTTKATAKPGAMAAARATAPDFTLTDQRGRKVTLSQVTRRGPVVLVFYRGFW